MSEFHLAREIIALSECGNWHQAKLEWSLSQIWFADEPQTCLCTHYPIIEICELSNALNGNRAEVGNVCVKKFMGLGSEILFASVRRVMLNRQDGINIYMENALNEAMIRFAYDCKWINKWEFRFYLSTWRKRNLSEKQLTTRRRINSSVLARMKREGI